MNMKETFGLNLPEQVPYLGFEEPYFLGNGVVMGGGIRNGMWDFCPGYSYGYADNMCKRERLKLYIDGHPYTLKGDIHRARGTGIFYSVQQFAKAAVSLIDFAPFGMDFIARMIAVRNTSDQDITIHPYTEYRFEEKRNIWEQTEHAFHLLHAKKSWMTVHYGGCVTKVRFYEHAVSTEFIVDSDDEVLKPGEVRYYTLYHDTWISERPFAEQTIIDRTAENGVVYLERCIAEWLDWSSKGLDLSAIPDEGCRDVLESCGVIMRMAQGVDGGVLACPKVYKANYVRDSISGMKGMLALKRYDEVKKYLQFQHAVYKKHSAKGEFGVPNACSIGGVGDNVFFGMGEDRYACEAPGLVAILTMQYYQATGDLDSIKSMDDFLRYCIKVQLEHAEQNNWLMLFNADETESQGCGIMLRETADNGKDWWSFTSNVICIKSVELMLEYMKQIGEEKTEQYSEYETKMHKLIDMTEQTFWDEELGIYHWFMMRDGTKPVTRISNFHIAPLYWNAPLNKERIESSGRNMLPYWNRETGFIPNQVFSENEDFCGHSLGYLLFMASVLGLEEADAIHRSLVHGASTSAYGMWAESHYDDGMPYDYPTAYDGKIHGLRTLESGINVDAIVTYWKTKGLWK